MQKSFKKPTSILLLASLLLVGCDVNIEHAESDNYQFYVDDTDGNAVEDVAIQICTDELCTVVYTNSDGEASYNGELAEYEVHIQAYPDGYYYDTEEIYVTSDSPEKITFTLEFAKDDDKTDNEQTNTEEDADVTTEKPAEEDSTGAETSTDTDATEEETTTETASAESGSTNTFPYVSKSITVTPSSDRISFSGTDFYGNAVDSSILSEYDLTLINIWEPWCGPCVGEMPEFEEAYELAKQAGIKFNVIGFYSTTDGVSDVIDDLGITYTIMKDTGFFNAFQTGYVPTNFFVNREGYVLPITADEMALFLEDYYDGYYTADELYDDAASMVYSKGQTNTFTSEMLYQFIANRL